jgi:carboxyl-terminal processing protease
VDILNTGKAEDMIDIMFMKIDKVVDYIRGTEGTSVGLKVEPAGGPPGVTKIVVIQRGKVEMKDEQARGDIIEMKSEKGAVRRLGVITLPSFYADFEEGKIRCSVDVEKILSRLITEKIDGLILDLRNNGGGSLEEVRRMTGFFMESGPVVQVKNTLGQVQVKDSDKGKPIYTGPMVVVIDKSSASASEILAGALQDFNRAVVVGDSSTFGKGTVQQPMDIGRMLPLFAARNRAGFLKVTIQKFYRPSGSSTQMDGVVPQVVIPSLSDALEIGEAYLDHPLPHDRIRPAPDFKPLASEGLFIPRLNELSWNRINTCKDFAYLIEDVTKAKNRIKSNRLSLNKAAREKELEESDALQKARNIERRERFAKMGEEDAKTMIFYKLRLEDLETNGELKRYNPTAENVEFMRRAKDATADLDETPKWPSGLDPLKRESLAVLKDLVDLTVSAPLTSSAKDGSGAQ